MPREATILEEQREDLIAFLAQRTSNQTRPALAELADYALDPNQTTTGNGIARLLGISKPTGRRYRDLILTFFENPAKASNPVVPSDEMRPSEAALENQRLEIEAHAQHERTGARNVNTPALGSDDVLDIIDRNIRRMDSDPSTPATSLKQMLDLKIKFQDLEAARSENLQDPTKVLGPNGLADLVPVLLGRFELLLSHRRELPHFFQPAATMIMKALTEDHENGATWHPQLTEAFDECVAMRETSPLPTSPTDLEEPVPQGEETANTEDVPRGTFEDDDQFVEADPDA